MDEAYSLNHRGSRGSRAAGRIQRSRSGMHDHTEGRSVRPARASVKDVHAHLQRTAAVQTITFAEMNKHDLEPHGQQRRLENIEARLARHHRATQLSLMVLSALGLVALALLGYIVTRL